MVDPINTGGQVPAANLQSSSAEQEAVNRRNEQEQQTVQQANPQDSVTIRSEASEQVPTPTSITNSDQAQEVASQVANLFQQQPELAATAQGGRLSAEKADAFLTANIG